MNEAGPDIIEQAQNLWNEGKDLEAIELLRPLSDGGDFVAKANLGVIMANHCENEQFPLLEEGAILLREAMDVGEPSAAHNLGTLYLGNLPTLGKNLKEAAKCFLKSRELGGPIADESWYQQWEDEITGS